MATQLKSIDEYEKYVERTIAPWTPEQRVALAAAMAERWLPVYEAFSAAEQWGDPASLRHSLDAVWNHLRGTALSRAEKKRLEGLVEESTPHMDDFDADAALAATAMLDQALECCVRQDNTPPTMQAIVSGFYAVAPEWDVEPAAERKAWRQSAVRREVKIQLALLQQIGAITRFDDGTIAALRQGLIKPDTVGKVPSPAKENAGPTRLTNQALFEQYRRMVESDLKSADTTWEKQYPPGSVTWALMHFSVWASRYGRRRDNINGEFGQPADVEAQRALVARRQARDAAEGGTPRWESDVREMIDMCFANPLLKLDTDSPLKPHGYGPSMRALWAAAKRLQQPDLAAWHAILAWARHRPAAWEAEDRRKKKGLAVATPELGNYLARDVAWSATGDVEFPWSAEVDGAQWQVRVNDFPDELMYSLIINGAEAGDFHDWPQNWSR